MALNMAQQALLISHQSVLYRCVPHARSRVTTALMVSAFADSTVTSALTATLYPLVGWAGISALGAVIALIALAIWSLELIRPSPAEPFAARRRTKAFRRPVPLPRARSAPTYQPRNTPVRRRPTGPRTHAVSGPRPATPAPEPGMGPTMTTHRRTTTAHPPRDPADGSGGRLPGLWTRTLGDLTVTYIPYAGVHVIPTRSIPPPATRTGQTTVLT
ncbi:hypothetical protein PUR57_11850 [Streptomyces sp. JV176]|uniref:hypothetical protein n=1 Tax=Streptomyces sp. JV176 TaxID=858630 RepID=UPI002E7A68F4|nr:hypothetical protein [Streptomyces sp. JV176]MEE1799360.1 hypothetical protein [Streptomyces sp. JV176]